MGLQYDGDWILELHDNATNTSGDISRSVSHFCNSIKSEKCRVDASAKMGRNRLRFIELVLECKNEEPGNDGVKRGGDGNS